MAGTPGALYITALHLLVNGESPTAVQAAGVAGFVVIEFALVIIPFGFLAARPQATERAVQRLRDWLTGHARELLAGAAVLAGGYMVISGTVRLLS